MLNVGFYGVRGSTPCACETNRRYGGNTSCVVLEAPGSDPVILDVGTGLRFYGQDLDGDRRAGQRFRGHALVTHLHWDHVQGLPFFLPLHHGGELDIYGPPAPGMSLEAAFGAFFRPPFFPITHLDLDAEVRFHDVVDTDAAVGDAKVTARSVPHIGPTNGYRVELGGVTVAYISDHQQPLDGGMDIDRNALELADGVDVLIHDAQYDAAEFAERPHWGHCAVEYALHVAREAGAKRLVLFHHDPGHDDATVDRLTLEMQDLAARTSSVEVLAAAEGVTLSLSGRSCGK